MWFFSSAKKLLRKTSEWKLKFLLSLCDCRSLLNKPNKYHGKIRTWQDSIFIHIYKTQVTHKHANLCLCMEKKEKQGTFQESVIFFHIVNFLPSFGR